MNLANLVDPNVHSYIKLRAKLSDDSLYTPSKHNSWHVLYDGVPEAALDQSLSYYFYTSTLQEGDSVRMGIAIRNVSEFDMDSLRVNYWVEDRYGAKHYVDYPIQDSLRAGEVLTETVAYSTQGLDGNNSFWVEVNPKDTLWQLEQYHFNNVARIAFAVEEDKTNPILDVTFDGIHILDGDIVSPSPTIVMQLNDENEYLIMDEDADTANFVVYLTDPDDTTKRIYFQDVTGEEIMSFTKASAPENKFKITYSPTFTEDGVYKIRVQGRDDSGNKSGAMDYEVSFEVILRSSITEVMNYPNPFSTSTRFVFTLTGSLIPDHFSIQILTVTGKVVREITRYDLGDLHIGRNITDYAWDGRDEYGDRLANGVYLYRVRTKINGQSIEHRTSGADPYFHKGFGKMYLMR